MVLKDEQPDSINDRSESSASVTTSISRLLERHLESFGAIKGEGVSTSRFIDNLNILSVEFGTTVDVNFLVFHQVLTEVDLLALFIGRSSVVHLPEVTAVDVIVFIFFVRHIQLADISSSCGSLAKSFVDLHLSLDDFLDSVLHSLVFLFSKRSEN